MAAACLATASALTLLSACSTSSTTTTADDATSVPMSASVTVPPGAATRTPAGTALPFGQTAVLPASAFALNGPLALYTVTGITRGSGLPDATTQGGTPYFIYLTVTSLADRPAPPPRSIGLAGSADGVTPALTIAPPSGQTTCVAARPPQTMRRGESYSTCLLSVADPDKSLQQVIYWADTTGDPTLDYQKSPVVWRSPTASTAPSSTPAAG